MRSTAGFRYEEVATFITALVDTGTLPPGARAPSLRAISKQRRISLSTAIQAYRLLEDRGVLTARPQSGYFIAKRASLQAPGISRPPAKSTRVPVSDVALKLLEHASDPRMAPLGCAIPSPAILSAGKLDRFLARAARVMGAEYNTYTLPKGDPRLRLEIARRAARWGQVQSAEDLVITCGCTEALTLALKAVCQAGDTVAIESPTYFGLLQVIQALNLRALELPTDPHSGIDVSALEKALKREPVKACLVASSFNNPLGCTMPEERKLALLRLLAKYEVALIEDDIYGDIYFGKERPKPFTALDPEGNRQGNIVYCSSFSKTVAPGYRIGWIAPGRYMPQVLAAKFASTLCGPALPQVALANFLASGGYDSHLRRMRRTFETSIGRMMATVHKTFPPGTRITQPAGGFVLWVELPKGLSTRDLFEQALERGICFAPGDVFSVSGRYANCLRLSCGHGWDARIESALGTLGQLAGAAMSRSPST
jgi:DNA-binding transcriptional MocR family regulator